MRLKDLREYPIGTGIYWKNPNGGLLSRTIIADKIEIEVPGPTVKISDNDGNWVRGHPREFYEEKPTAFFRTIVKVEVLSEYELSTDLDLDNIDHLITDGDCSGKVEISPSVKVSPRKMAKLLEGQGSAPSFFNLDENGNRTEDA